MRGIKSIVAIVLGLVIMLTGCAKETVAPTTSAPTGPTGTLTIGTSSFGDEILYPPQASGSTHRLMLFPMLEPLVKYDKDVIPAPNLCTKWELDSSGLVWTYYIQQGIKFHNGEDLTADDVKFSLDQFLAKDALYADLRNRVQSVEKVDDYTIKIITKNPQPYLNYSMTVSAYTQGTIMPKDYIEKNGIDAFKRQPVGSGPYKFVNYTPGDSIEFEALDEHWRRVGSFKNIKVVLMPEETTRVAALKTGELDVIDIGLEADAKLSAEGYKTVGMEYYQPQVLLMGANNPKSAGKPITDIRVRKALSLAINQEEIAKDFFNGRSKPIQPPNFSDSAADFDAAYWENYMATAARYDPEEAKKLLKEAGYPDGFSIDLWAYTAAGSPYLDKLAEVIQANWGAIGVKAKLVPTDFGTFKANRTGPGAPLMGQASMYRMDEAPVAQQNLQAGYHSKNGFLQMVWDTNPALDKLIETSISEIDTTKRKAALAEAARISTESYTTLPIGAAPMLCALGPRVDVVDIPRVWQGLLIYPEYYIHRAK